MLLYSELTDKILKAAFMVHRELGCGFFEKVYQEALAIAFDELNIPYEREKHLDVVFHGHLLNCDYIADFVVDKKVILELKAVKKMETLFEAQLLNYLKATGLNVGFVMNFGEEHFNFKRLFRDA